MKSGLEGRNNIAAAGKGGHIYFPVSMKSGLEGRNNLTNERPDRYKSLSQ